MFSSKRTPFYDTFYGIQVKFHLTVPDRHYGSYRTVIRKDVYDEVDGNRSLQFLVDVYDVGCGDEVFVLIDMEEIPQDYLIERGALGYAFNSTWNSKFSDYIPKKRGGNL
ncbi:MAG: hypothetical protein RSC93_02270 [Erysipelotrichaceae bacterium]